MPSFEFADCPTRIDLTVAADTQAQSGTLNATVRNVTAQRQIGRIRIEALGDAKPEWFSLAGAPATSPREIEQDFAPSGTLTVQVAVKVPPKTPAGVRTFRLHVNSEAVPDTDFAAGPAVSIDIAPWVEPAAPAKSGLPWWAFAIAGVFVAAVLGTVAWLAWPSGLDPKLVVGKSLVEARKIAADRGFRQIGVETGDAWGNNPADRVVVGVRAAGPTLLVDDGVTLPREILGQPYNRVVQIMLDRGVFPALVLGVPGPEGVVVMTNPPPGVPVAMGTPVVVTVGTRPLPPPFTTGAPAPCLSLPGQCGINARPYSAAEVNAVSRERLQNRANMVEIILRGR